MRGLRKSAIFKENFLSIVNCSLNVVMIILEDIISLDRICGGELTIEPVVTNEESVKVKSYDNTNLRRDFGVGVFYLMLI